MAGELPKILDHIEKMDELDLEGVEPTSHVVELENVLREDVPRPSLPRERALEPAPDAAGRRASACPSPGARERRAARADRRRRRRDRVRAGELSAAELFEFWRERAAGRRARLLPLGGRRAGRRDGPAPLAACRSRSRTSSASRACRAPPARASSRATARRTRPPRSRNLAGGGRAGARQDQPGRVRDGLVQRELRLRPGAEPLGPRARARRLERRLGRGGGGRHRALGDRHRHRRLDPPARLALRHRRAQAHLRRGLAATG